MANEKSRQIAFRYSAKVRDMGPQACNSPSNYPFPARRPSAHPSPRPRPAPAPSVRHPPARAGRGRPNGSRIRPGSRRGNGGRGEGSPDWAEPLPEKQTPGYLKAVGLETFGPVSNGFPAESDPRDRPRRPRSPSG